MQFLINRIFIFNDNPKQGVENFLKLNAVTN